MTSIVALPRFKTGSGLVIALVLSVFGSVVASAADSVTSIPSDEEWQRNLSTTIGTEEDDSPADTGPLLDSYNEQVRPAGVDGARLDRLADEIVLLLPEPSPSIAKRLWEWVKTKLAGSEWFQRFSDWLERVAPSVQISEGIFWFVAFGFIVGTLGFVFYELYKAGLFRRNHQRQSVGVDLQGAETRAPRERNVRELEGISQVRALFGGALYKLRDAGALPESDSYTNQSLARLLDQSAAPGALAPDVSEKFSALVQHTDLALYANQLPNSPEWQSLIDYWLPQESS